MKECFRGISVCPTGGATTSRLALLCYLPAPKPPNYKVTRNRPDVKRDIVLSDEYGMIEQSAQSIEHLRELR